MKHLAEPLGALTAIAFTLAFLNFFIKRINKYYIVKSSNVQLKKNYGKVMRLFINYHRYFGLIAAFAVIVHYFIASNYVFFSTTGIVAAGLLVILAMLGVYGFYYKKKAAMWLKIHRIVAFILAGSIAIHLISLKLR